MLAHGSQLAVWHLLARFLPAQHGEDGWKKKWRRSGEEEVEEVEGVDEEEEVEVMMLYVEICLGFPHRRIALERSVPVAVGFLIQGYVVTMLQQCNRR